MGIHTCYFCIFTLLRGVNETHAARDPDTFHNWKLELPSVDKSYRVLLLDGYLRRHSNYICKLDDRYKIRTTVTKLCGCNGL